MLESMTKLTPPPPWGYPLVPLLVGKKMAREQRKEVKKLKGKLRVGQRKGGENQGEPKNKSSGSLGLQVSRAFLEEGSVQTLGEAGGKEI